MCITINVLRIQSQRALMCETKLLNNSNVKFCNSNGFGVRKHRSPPRIFTLLIGSSGDRISVGSGGHRPSALWSGHVLDWNKAKSSSMDPAYFCPIDAVFGGADDPQNASVFHIQAETSCRTYRGCRYNRL